jgi:hypothetical protein
MQKLPGLLQSLLSTQWRENHLAVYTNLADNIHQNEKKFLRKFLVEAAPVTSDLFRPCSPIPHLGSEYAEYR